MINFLAWLTDTSGFVPRKDCGDWPPGLVWLHVGSDLFIWLAYLSIPLVLLYFVRRRRDLPFSRLLVLFAAFILACGFTHFIEALSFTHPMYRLSGVLKLLTAVLSWATVLMLVPAVPKILELVTMMSRVGDDSRVHRKLTVRTPSRTRDYAMAVLAAVLAVLVRQALDPILKQDYAFIVATLAVIFVAWESGFGPALTTTAISALATVYWILPGHTLMIDGQSHRVGFALFVFGGVMCALLGESQRHAQARADQALADSQERRAGLEAEIAHRTRIEQELRERTAQLLASESRFRVLADSVPVHIWVADLSRQRTYFNRSWLDFVGSTLEQELGDLWTRQIHPDDRSGYLSVFTAAFAAREPFEMEYRLRRHDGVYRWMLTRATPQIAPSGEFTGFVGMCMDITDRKQAAEALKESEERFRTLAQAVPPIVWVAGPDGGVEYLNPRWAKFTGTPADDALGRRWFEHVHPADRSRAEERWTAVVATGSEYEVQFQLRRRDGEYEWFLVRAIPQRDAAGGVLRWFGTCSNIHATRRLAEHLRQSLDRFRGLTESIPQLVWTATADGGCDYLSRQWVEYTGVPEIEHHGIGWLNAVAPDDRDRVAAAWRAAVAGQAPYDVEYRLRRADGAYRWFKARGNSTRDTAGHITQWVGATTDIDDQKRQSEMLEHVVRARTADLHRSNRDLEQFAYVASHDLQEPLRKIQAFGDLLAAKCRDNLPENGREYLLKMQGAAGRMRRLIDDLLTYSRVTTQARSFVRVDLNSVLADVLDVLEVRIEQTGAALEVGNMPTIEGDPSQIRQLLQNLLSNALQYHQPGKPPAVRIHAEPDGDGHAPAAYRIRVSDSGIGFDEKYLGRIFQVFQRLHGRNEYDGSGIGLAICKKITERHHGSITAHSKPGHGAEFIITLPSRQPPDLTPNLNLMEDPTHSG